MEEIFESSDKVKPTDSNFNLGNKYISTGINIWSNRYYKERHGKQKLNMALESKKEVLDNISYLFNEDGKKMEFYNMVKSMNFKLPKGDEEEN